MRFSRGYVAAMYIGIGTLLLIMILVPTTLVRAMAEPHIAAAAFHEGWARTTRYVPLRVAGTQIRARLPRPATRRR